MCRFRAKFEADSVRADVQDGQRFAARIHQREAPAVGTPCHSNQPAEFIEDVRANKPADEVALGVANKDLARPAPATAHREQQRSVFFFVHLERWRLEPAAALPPGSRQRAKPRRSPVSACITGRSAGNPDAVSSRAVASSMPVSHKSGPFSEATRRSLQSPFFLQPAFARAEAVS